MIFRKLSEVAPPRASRTKPAPNEKVWHLTLDQIESGSGQIVSRVYGCASEASSSTFAFDRGNVLYSKLRPYLNKVICPETNGIATTELVPLRPIPSELNREYLCLYLRSAEFVSWASAQVDGAKMPRMNMRSFWAHTVPVPPLDYQIRIAHLLGKVEKLVAQRKQHLQQLDDLLKSVFLEMFGDPILNPHGFALRKLPEFYVNPHEGTKCGPFGSALKKNELVDVGIPVWNMDNIGTDGRMVLPFRMWITEEKYTQLAAYSVQDGDILISRAGTVGKMCIARMDGQPAVLSTNLIRLRLGDALRPLYFVSLMLYCKGRVGRLKTGPDGALTHMNTGILDSLKFPYPPIGLQDEFAAIVNRVDALKSRYRQALTDLATFYAALSQSAFKGELDLSRIPLPAITLKPEPMEDTTTITVDLDVPASPLPDLGLPVAELANEANQLTLLIAWLEAWNVQLGERTFALTNFMDAAQSRLQELYPNDDLELGMAAYEQIKGWVFGALDHGTLTQGYDEETKRITLKTAQA
jgi:type I restriction enzyme S subunit